MDSRSHAESGVKRVAISAPSGVTPSVDRNSSTRCSSGVSRFIGQKCVMPAAESVKCSASSFERSETTTRS